VSISIGGFVSGGVKIPAPQPKPKPVPKPIPKPAPQPAPKPAPQPVYSGKGALLGKGGTAYGGSLDIIGGFFGS